MRISDWSSDVCSSDLDRRNVVNEPRDHAATPGARVHVAVTHDAGIDARDLGRDIGKADRIAKRALLLEQALDPGVGEHAFGVAQGTHHEDRKSTRLNSSH